MIFEISINFTKVSMNSIEEKKMGNEKLANYLINLIS